MFSISRNGYKAGMRWRVIHEGSGTPVLRGKALIELAQKEARKDYYNNPFNFTREHPDFMMQFVLAYTQTQVVTHNSNLPKNVTIEELLESSENYSLYWYHKLAH